MRRIGKRGLIAICIVVAIVIPLSIFVIIPVARGSTRLLVVLSGSMSPAMDPGDVAVVTRIDPSELKVGDIVAYHGDANNPKNIVSHRVVEVIDGGLGFRTKGDANEDPDPHIVRSSDVVGKVAFTIPYAGYIFHYARKPVGFVLLVMVPAVLLIAIEARRIASHVKRRSQKGVGKDMLRRAASLPLAASLLLIFLTSVSMTPTGAYFHDVEVSANNVFVAGFWAISGEIVDFIVPERVILDEAVEFTVLFKNTGDVSLAARAFVEVRKGKDGKIVATENGALVEVGVGETIDLEVQWNTSGASPGNYWGIAWVCFDSASTSTTEPEKFKVKHDSATEFVVSGKHVVQISTGDGASNIDNGMLDNSILENASLGDNSAPDNSTSLGDDNSVPDNSTSDASLGDDNNSTSSDALLDDNSAPDNNSTSLGDDNSTSSDDNSTSSDALLDDNSAPDSLGDDNSAPDSDASLGDDNSVPDNSTPDNSTPDNNSTSLGEDSSALDNSDDSTSQEIGDNTTFPENDNSVMDEGAFGKNNDVSARDNGTILENEGATHEEATEENSDFDEGTSEVSENASLDDNSASDNSLSPEIGGAENNEGSGLAENSSADNENAGLAENTITDNENPEIGGTLVDNGCTENSEVTENMAKDNENPDVVENTLANDENSEVGGVVQVPLEGV